MKVLFKVTVITIAMSVSSGASAKERVPSVESVTTSAVRFERVEIGRQDGRFVVSGKVKRRVYNSHVWPGHIDYVAIGSNGEVVAKGAVTYTPSLSLRRWKYGSDFSVLLPESVTEDASIKVAFHKNQSATKKYSAPAQHEVNVLVDDD
ncbi:MAG: hypothetical protein GYB33_08090 [Gammaproteobacteria bacterium]|nr:hypothetical protein [Gammaproteobacteria bacterium]